MSTDETLTAKSPPFDLRRLDALMDDAGLDVLILTSKHNVQYMLGGYRFFMFDTMDAIGLSRYLPILVYPRGVRRHGRGDRNGLGSLRRRPQGLESRRSLTRVSSFPANAAAAMAEG